MGRARLSFADANRPSGLSGAGRPLRRRRLMSAARSRMPRSWSSEKSEMSRKQRRAGSIGRPNSSEKSVSNPARAPAGKARPDEIRDLLFVIDTVNTAMGTSGQMWLDDISLELPAIHDERMVPRKSRSPEWAWW